MIAIGNVCGIGGRLKVKRKEGVTLRTGAAAAAQFSREAGDEDPRKASRDEDGEGENVHRWKQTAGCAIRKSGLVLDCGK